MIFCGLRLAGPVAGGRSCEHRLAIPEPSAPPPPPSFHFIITMADTQQAASASPMPPGVTDPNYKPLPGRLGNLTVPQQHALDNLKKSLKGENKFVANRMDDATLLRFAGSRFRSLSN
jgi:hypothetical protein